MKPAGKGGGANGNGKKPEYTFCRVCRINHNHGAKHKFHKKHVSTLQSALAHESEKISEIRSFAVQRLTGGLFSAQRWCLFCDKDTTTKDTAFLSMLQHLSSSEHKKNVVEFLRDMGSNENRSKFYFQKNVLKQFVSGGDPTAENGGASAPDTPSTNSSGPTSPVVADGAPDKKEDEGPKVPKTVISTNGIRQNPTGWDHGERVWGGGIVKYKRDGEWQPWPIDLDNESDIFDPSTLMGGTVYPALFSSAGSQNNIVSSLPAGSGATLSSTGVFTHPSMAAPQERKQTEYAYSADLTRIEAVPLQVGQGNVHSGATPPWMVDDSGSTIPTIPQTLTLSEREKRGKKRQLDGKKNPRKLKALDQRDHSNDPTWLPNFGSVWTAGPRSETRKNFVETKHNPNQPRGGATAAHGGPVDVHTKLKNLTKHQQEMGF